MSNKKLMMTEKDKDDFVKLLTGKWPGRRAYNRLTKAMDEGGFDFTESDRRMDERLDKLFKFIDKELAQKAKSKKKKAA